ncbi:MAG: ABC transporter ATP-binding protein/permease [Christensenellaceae bacterium]|jgi:ATP-binding cassette subfamily B protein|nr:ABC transporter ATP-binding protein/permease [Christensenellaceae bacterium]
MRKILGVLKPHVFMLSISLLCAIISTVFALLGPDMLSQIGSEVAAAQRTGSAVDFEFIKRIGITLAIIYSSMFILDYAQQLLTARVVRKISFSLRSDIGKKINLLPFDFYDKTNTGDIMSRITGDVDTLSGNLSQNLIYIITSSVMVIGSGIFMFIINWILALIAVGITLLGVIVMVVLLKISQKYFRQRAELFGVVNGIAEESFSNHLAITTNNAELHFENKFSSALDKIYITTKKSQFLSGIMQPMMSMVGNFSFVAVIVVGSIMAARDLSLIADIIAFMLYVRYFARPFADIANASSGLQSSVASGERVFNFLAEAELPDETAIQDEGKPKKFDGNVEFKNLGFTYRVGTPTEKPVIKNFNAKIKSGQRVAIVGPTGAGKTTIASLLMKFYEITKGDILFDGVSIHSLSRQTLHEQFAMVLQDSWLFNGTVADNLRFNKLNVTDKEIQDVVKEVNLTLPLDLKITEKTSLSKGQRQLITIARAMLKESPMLILDEATSSVDTRTEKLVADAMEKLMEGRTSFVIAHRLSTIKNADVILVVNNGDIVEQGTHSALLRKKGFYAKLYNSQFA